MVRVKSAEAVDAAYKAAIPRVPGAYKAGVQATVDWKNSALEGQDLYEERMRDPAVLNRRRAGLEGVSEEEWKRKAADVGATRIGPGMQAGAAKRKAKWAPFREALVAVDLPPRTADPMANIDNRVKPIAQALINKKKEITG